VAGGTGTVGSGDVTSITVNCANNRFTVGGNVSGLVGSVVVQDNGGDNLTLASVGSFAFPTTLATGANYAVTVLTQPAHQTCVVGAGTGMVTGNVTSVTLTCTGTPYSVGGTVSGLPSGTNVVLQDNGGNDLTVNANGLFTFTQQVNYGSTYAVTVRTSPTGQTCTVANGTGTGTVTGTVTSVAVTCAPTLFTIGGNVQGLNSAGMVTLQDNGSDDLIVTGTNAFRVPFTFATGLADGTAYAVTVSTQPNGQTCRAFAGSGSGMVNGANVTNVLILCQ
ncbi:MAG TPA: hypothetical protein VKU41_07745, partial [Polyangiaceae bacterium]|nr:hypothetical protein [Polyangiaceae bacterium]